MLRVAWSQSSGAAARVIEWDEGRRLVTQGCEGTLWVDAVSPTVEELADLEATFGLHPLTVEDLIHKNQRAKIEEFNNYLFVVMHWYAKDQHHIDDDLYELHCVLGKHFLLTVSDPTELLPVKSAWARFLGGTGQRGPGGPESALYRVLDELVDAHGPRVDALEDDVEAIGQRVNALEGTQSVIKALSQIRRAIVRFRRVISAERDVVQALTRRDYAMIDPKTSVYFRDVADHLTRTYEALDALREHADLITQEHFAFTENQRSRIIKRLTVVSTIFLPMNFLAGFFGMNFTHFPFDSTPLMYGAFASFILVPSAFMLSLLLARSL